ncbi:hypothetical protein GOV11_01790 [Candidatus Woesearchaeota archaeon]|nr:hypothetical protein [Candidatus Woesearchaeota archaeon]
MRNNLRNLLSAGLCTLMMGCASMPRTTPNAVNRELRDIQATLEAMPEVHHTRLCEVPGANRTIIHIRQAHYIAPAGILLLFTDAPTAREMIRKEREKNKIVYNHINKVQSQIYNIIDTLGVKHNLRDFWVEEAVEGLFDKRYPDYAKKFFSLTYRMMLKDLFDAGIIEGEALESYTKTKKSIKDLDESYKFIPGAHKLAFIEDKIQLHHTHDPVTYYSMHYADKSSEFALDFRENMAINYIRKAKHTHSPLIYGAAHAFGGPKSCNSPDEPHTKSYDDNIARNNRVPFGSKFSLLEVTPAAVEEGLSFE